MYNKKLLSKAICISAVCVLLASNASFATENDKIKEAKVSTNVEAEKDYSVDKFYDILQENSDIIYTGERDPFAGKKYLDKLKAIADKNTENKDLQRDYHKNNAYYNRNYENRFETVDQLEVAKKYLNNDIEEQLHVYDELAKSYTEVWDFDKAEQAYKQIDILMKKNKNSIEPRHIVGNAASKMYFYLGTGDLDKVFDCYKQARKTLDSLDKKDLNLELELNGPVLSYYFTTHDMKNVKESLDYYMWLANETENESMKEFVLREYLHYYQTILDIEGTNKAAKKLIKETKGIHTYDGVDKIWLDIDIINKYRFEVGTYENAKKFTLNPEKYTKKAEASIKRAEKLAKNTVAESEKHKDIAPTVYGISLQKLAEVYSKQNKLEETEKTMTEAIKYFAKASRELTYYLFGGNLAFGNAYHNLEQYDKAIAKYKELEKELNKKPQVPFTMRAAIYYNLAETYSKIGNEKEAIKNINKVIDIYTPKFGAESINVLYAYKKKVDLYENLGKKDLAIKEAKELIFKIKEHGINNTFNLEFECYYLLAKDSLEKGKLDDAFAYANKALETSSNNISKEDANDLISEICKQQGKTLKALKYKIK